MSGAEYVPTTDEVREAFALEHEYGCGEGSASNDQRDEFDRWLTAHDARIASEAAEAERDRLLELAKTTPLSLRQVINREVALEQWTEYADRLANEREGASDE